MTIRRWQCGLVRDAWPGITVTGVVVAAGAVLADAYSAPPRGGGRLLLGLGLGAVLIGLGYLLRLRASRDR